MSVSREIARRENLEQLHLGDIRPDPAQLAAMLEDYAGETCAVEPAQSVLKFRYDDLHARHLVIVDGAMAEIGRRQYLKRLVTAGRGAMRRGRPEEIMPFLAAHRAAIMQPDAAALMRRGALAELETAWRAMPPVASIGEENFADLLVVRARYPHYAGRGQSRFDASAISYMPFAQPTVIGRVMRLPLARRGSARLLRSIIRTYRPSLMKLPAVKAGGIYPIGLPPIAAWAYTKLRKKLGGMWQDQAPFTLLDILHEYVRDLVASRDVREYGPYDYAKIKRMTDAYYAGDRSHARELNWWLAFDAWRRGVGGEGTMKYER